MLVLPPPVYTGKQTIARREVDGLGEDETQRLLKVSLGRLEELSAEMKGTNRRLDRIEGGVTKLQAKVTTLQDDVSELTTEFRAFRQETNKRFDAMDGRLEWVAARMMEHDAAIFQLQRRQG